MQCQAIVEDFTGPNAKRYSMQRVTSPEVRGCRRSATWKLGTLCLCGQHNDLAREGLIDSDGHVAARADIRIVRRYPKKGPLYSWALALDPIPLDESK